jgi:hypothetical protein
MCNAKAGLFFRENGGGSIDCTTVCWRFCHPSSGFNPVVDDKLMNSSHTKFLQDVVNKRKQDFGDAGY